MHFFRAGDDRRQPILKEAQVARLYGEETLRDIVRQSQTMPLAIPLAFGCGSVRAGDWRPARREFKPNGITWGDRLSVLLSLPFCGFSSLSALINEITVNGKRDPNTFVIKNSQTTVAGSAYWLWMATGYPAAGVIPAAGLASTATTATTTGAIGQPNAPASNTKHLLSASGMSTVAAGAVLFADMTLLVQPVLATTTAQTITGSPSRYQSNGNNGILPFAIKGSAADANAAPTLTVTYTESTAGTTGHTTGGVTGNATNPAFRTEIGSGQLFLPLAAGDVGVRRIETTTWSVARSQATTFGLAYPYAFLPMGAANALFGLDCLNTQFNLPQIIDGACITFFLMAAASSSGLIQMEIVLGSGNS